MPIPGRKLPGHSRSLNLLRIPRYHFGVTNWYFSNWMKGINYLGIKPDLTTNALPNTPFPGVVLQNKMKGSGAGEAVRSGWTNNSHSQLPSSPVKRFLSGYGNCSISLVLKVVPPSPAIIILLDKLLKSTCSFSPSSFLIGTRQSHFA